MTGMVVVAAFAARAIGVVDARDQPDGALAREDVLVAQAERLPDPHPGPEQQREQKPVPQPRLRSDHRRHLSHRQRPG